MIRDVDEEAVAGMHVQSRRFRAIFGHKAEESIAVWIDGSFVSEVDAQDTMRTEEVLRLSNDTSCGKARTHAGVAGADGDSRR